MCIKESCRKEISVENGKFHLMSNLTTLFVILEFHQRCHLAIRRDIFATFQKFKFYSEIDIHLLRIHAFYQISTSMPAKNSYEETLTFGLNEKFAHTSVLNKAINMAIQKHPALSYIPYGSYGILDADAYTQTHCILFGFSDWSMVLVCLLYLHDSDTGDLFLCFKVYRKIRRVSYASQMASYEHSVGYTDYRNSNKRFASMGI